MKKTKLLLTLIFTFSVIIGMNTSAWAALAEPVVIEKDIFISEHELVNEFCVNDLTEYRLIDEQQPQTYCLSSRQFIELISKFMYEDEKLIFSQNMGATFSADYDNGIFTIHGQEASQYERMQNIYTKSDSMYKGNVTYYGKFTLEATFCEENQPISVRVLDWNNYSQDAGNREAPYTSDSIVTVGDQSIYSTYVTWNFTLPQVQNVKCKLTVNS